MKNGKLNIFFGGRSSLCRSLGAVLLLVAAANLIFTGCKLGKKLNPNSSGVISVTRPNGQWVNPNSPAKIKLPKSEPVKMTNRIARITLPKGKSAPSINKLTPAKGRGELIKLKPSEVELLLPKFETSNPVKIAVNVIPASENKSDKDVIEIVAVEEKKNVSVNWGGLVLYYSVYLAALTALLGWFGYGLYKEHKQAKSEQDNPLEPDDKKNTPDEKKELP